VQAEFHCNSIEKKYPTRLNIIYLHSVMDRLTIFKTGELYFISIDMGIIYFYDFLFYLILNFLNILISEYWFCGKRNLRYSLFCSIPFVKGFRFRFNVNFIRVCLSVSTRRDYKRPKVSKDSVRAQNEVETRTQHWSDLKQNLLKTRGGRFFFF
jgi:hypothetical protein